jgi:predicted membrane protein (TIGR00267 family)
VLLAPGNVCEAQFLTPAFYGHYAERTKRMKPTKEIEVLQRYWRDETEAAAVYDRLAREARNEETRQLLLEMRDTERRHAERWNQRIVELGGQLPAPPSSWKARWLGWLSRLAGQQRIFRQLEAVERQAVTGYGANLTDAASARVAAQIQADEKQHAIELRAMTRSEPQGVEAILNRETWHRAGGGATRELVFGVNDGLVSTLSLVSGVAGAAVSQGVVLLAGLAGLISGAISMAAGAYISTKSQREVHEAQVTREREELAQDPEEEMAELRTLYRLKGYSAEEAERLTERISQDSDLMLESLVRDELGLMPETFPNPLLAGAQSGGAFVVGAFIPLAGYLLFSGVTATLASVGISIAALFVVGVLKTLFTGLSWLRSGLEMVGIGIFATVTTYLIGSLFDMAV